MKNINVCLLAAVACTYSLQASASFYDNINSVSEDNALSLSISSFAPNDFISLELEPRPNFIGVKLASVCHITDVGCKDDNTFNLDNSAQCNDEGFYLSCPPGYSPDYSQKCPFNDSFVKCRICSQSCDSGSITPCSSEQITVGTSSNECNDNCYTCRDKTCEEGGYVSSITSCQNANSINFAGKICYYNVTTKTCADGGYVNSVPSNQVGQSTNFCGNICYYNLRTPSCSEGGHLDSIPVNQKCNSTTYYGQTCYSGCHTPSCSEGSYIASIPAYQSCSSTVYYGQTCYYDCKDNCPYNGTLTSCPTGHICTFEPCSNKYYITGCAINYINYCNQPVTDCATLGYNKASCPNGFIRCPYDATQLQCF